MKTQHGGTSLTGNNDDLKFAFEGKVKPCLTTGGKTINTMRQDPGMTPRPENFDWNDLKFLLAVAEAGSTLAAARTLKVDQTTVARRIAALEAAFGLPLMERRQSGYVPTEDGQMALDHARRMASVATDLAGQVDQQRRTLQGVIRLTLTESVANQMITPALSTFYEQYPDIRIEMLIDDRRLDLVKGEADIAIRAGRVPDTAGLAVRQLFSSSWSLYCSAAYAARKGMPLSEADLKGHALVLCEGTIGHMPAMEWLKAAAPDAVIGNVSSSLANAIVAIQAGLGVGALPNTLGIGAPDLVRAFGPIPGSDYDFFLLIRENVRHLPRIRAFIDFFSAHIVSAFHRQPTHA